MRVKTVRANRRSHRETTHAVADQCLAAECQRKSCLWRYRCHPSSSRERVGIGLGRNFRSIHVTVDTWLLLQDSGVALFWCCGWLRRQGSTIRLEDAPARPRRAGLVSCDGEWASVQGDKDSKLILRLLGHASRSVSTQHSSARYEIAVLA